MNIFFINITRFPSLFCIQQLKSRSCKEKLKSNDSCTNNVVTYFGKFEPPESNDDVFYIA